MRYSYKCDRCGYIFDEHRPAARRNDAAKCPECLGPAGRSFKETIKDSKIDATMKENERWSISMGVPPSQVNEFRRRFPTSTYDDRGRLLIKNREHKKAEMKRRNFIELD